MEPPATGSAQEVEVTGQEIEQTTAPGAAIEFSDSPSAVTPNTDKTGVESPKIPEFGKADLGKQAGTSRFHFAKEIFGHQVDNLAGMLNLLDNMAVIVICKGSELGRRQEMLNARETDLAIREEKLNKLLAEKDSELDMLRAEVQMIEKCKAKLDFIAEYLKETKSVLQS